MNRRWLIIRPFWIFNPCPLVILNKFWNSFRNNLRFVCFLIVIKKNNNKIQCLCDCNAGRSKMHCKHWMGVFEGKKQEYIGISKEQLDEIKSWLSGSDVEQAWNDYQKIKEKEDDLKKQIALEKNKIMKKLQKAMLDI